MLAASHVRQFLSHLAVNRGVSHSTQAIAFNALVYLYNHVLARPLGDFRKAATKPSCQLCFLSLNVIHLPHTFCKPAQTFERFKNSSVIRM